MKAINRKQNRIKRKEIGGKSGREKTTAVQKVQVTFSKIPLSSCITERPVTTADIPELIWRRW